MAVKKLPDLPPLRPPVRVYEPSPLGNPEWAEDRKEALFEIRRSLEPEWGIGAYALAMAFGAALAKAMRLR